MTSSMFTSTATLSLRLELIGSMRLKVLLLFSVFAALRFVIRRFPSRLVLAFTSSVGAITGRFCRRDRSIAIAQMLFSLPQGNQRQAAAPESAAGNRDDLRRQKASSPEHCRKDVDLAKLSRLSLDVFRHTGECVGEVLIWDRIFRPRNNSVGHKLDRLRVSNRNGGGIAAGPYSAQAGSSRAECAFRLF